jgi:hypothetical protein
MSSKSGSNAASNPHAGQDVFGGSSADLLDWQIPQWVVARLTAIKNGPPAEYDGMRCYLQCGSPNLFSSFMNGARSGIYPASNSKNHFLMKGLVRQWVESEGPDFNQWNATNEVPLPLARDTRSLEPAPVAADLDIKLLRRVAAGAYEPIFTKMQLVTAAKLVVSHKLFKALRKPESYPEMMGYLSEWCTINKTTTQLIDVARAEWEMPVDLIRSIHSGTFLPDTPTTRITSDLMETQGMITRIIKAPDPFETHPAVTTKLMEWCTSNTSITADYKSLNRELSEGESRRTVMNRLDQLSKNRDMKQLQPLSTHRLNVFRSHLASFGLEDVEDMELSHSALINAWGIVAFLRRNADALDDATARTDADTLNERLALAFLVPTQQKSRSGPQQFRPGYLSRVAQAGVHLNTPEMSGHMDQASQILVQDGHRQETGKRNSHVMGQVALAQTIEKMSAEEAKGASVVFMVDGGKFKGKKVVYQRITFWKEGLEFNEQNVEATTSQIRQNNLRAEALICKATGGAFRDVFAGMTEVSGAKTADYQKSFQSMEGRFATPMALVADGALAIKAANDSGLEVPQFVDLDHWATSNETQTCIAGDKSMSKTQMYAPTTRQVAIRSVMTHCAVDPSFPAAAREVDMEYSAKLELRRHHCAQVDGYKQRRFVPIGRAYSRFIGTVTDVAHFLLAAQDTTCDEQHLQIVTEPANLGLCCIEFLCTQPLLEFLFSLEAGGGFTGYLVRRHLLVLVRTLTSLRDKPEQAISDIMTAIVMVGGSVSASLQAKVGEALDESVRVSIHHLRSSPGMYHWLGDWGEVLGFGDCYHVNGGSPDRCRVEMAEYRRRLRASGQSDPLGVFTGLEAEADAVQNGTIDTIWDAPNLGGRIAEKNVKPFTRRVESDVGRSNKHHGGLSMERIQQRLILSDVKGQIRANQCNLAAGSEQFRQLNDLQVQSLRAENVEGRRKRTIIAEEGGQILYASTCEAADPALLGCRVSRDLKRWEQGTLTDSVGAAPRYSDAWWRFQAVCLDESLLSILLEKAEKQIPFVEAFLQGKHIHVASAQWRQQEVRLQRAFCKRALRELTAQELESTIEPARMQLVCPFLAMNPDGVIIVGLPSVPRSDIIPPFLEVGHDMMAVPMGTRGILKLAFTTIRKEEEWSSLLSGGRSISRCNTALRAECMAAMVAARATFTDLIHVHFSPSFRTRELISVSQLRALIPDSVCMWRERIFPKAGELVSLKCKLADFMVDVVYPRLQLVLCDSAQVPIPSDRTQGAAAMQLVHKSMKPKGQSQSSRGVLQSGNPDGRAPISNRKLLPRVGRPLAPNESSAGSWHRLPLKDLLLTSWPAGTVQDDVFYPTPSQILGVEFFILMMRDELFQNGRRSDAGFFVGMSGSGKSAYARLLRHCVSLLGFVPGVLGVWAQTHLAVRQCAGDRTVQSGIGSGINLTDDQILANYDLPRGHPEWSKYEAKKSDIRCALALLLDEGPTISRQRYELIDRVCRKIKDPTQPFGGMKLVLCGDPFQGSGVPTAAERQGWQPFQVPAKVVLEGLDDMNMFSLKAIENTRVVDPRLWAHLLGYQLGEPTEDAKDTLVKMAKARPKDVMESKSVFPTGAEVDRFNEKMLQDECDSSMLSSYTTVPHGDCCDTALDAANALHSEMAKRRRWSAAAGSSDCVLQLAEKAQVRFTSLVEVVTPDGLLRILPGIEGIVVSFDHQLVPVQCCALDGRYPCVELTSGDNKGKTITVGPVTMQVEARYHGDMKPCLASLTLVPLTLDWARSVAMAQGSEAPITFSPEKCFDWGMFYIGLGRMTEYASLRLTSLNLNLLRASPEAKAWWDRQPWEENDEFLFAELAKRGLTDVYRESLLVRRWLVGMKN